MTLAQQLARPELRTALAGHLLAVADDELVLGHRHSEWTGFAPDIESDVALSSVAQEEIGHARLFYEQVAELLGGTSPDALAYGRAPEAFRNAVLVERPNGDWAFTIVRMFLYDHADAVRLDALAGGRVAAVADLARTIRREEKYHQMYGEQWLRHLTAATPGSRQRVQAALDDAWPQARAIFARVDGADALIQTAVVAMAADGQQRIWRGRVGGILEAAGLRVPEDDATRGGPNGRAGRHTDDLRILLDEMTSVWRSEPGAKW